MMKSFILAATSIACVLSLANISNAKDRGIDRPLITQNRSNLVAKKSSALSSYPITKIEIKELYQLINERYKRMNIAQEGGSGAKSFVEIKSLKLVDVKTLLGETEFILEATMTTREYSYGNETNPIKIKAMNGVVKTVFTLDKEKEETINVYAKKRQGKWVM